MTIKRRFEYIRFTGEHKGILFLDFNTANSPEFPQSVLGWFKSVIEENVIVPHVMTLSTVDQIGTHNA